MLGVQCDPEKPKTRLTGAHFMTVARLGRVGTLKLMAVARLGRVGTPKLMTVARLRRVGTSSFSNPPNNMLMYRAIPAKRTISFYTADGGG